MTLQDYIAAVGLFAPGSLPLGETEKILAINMAVKAHSKNKPRIVIEDEAGTGDFDYAVSLLTSWTAGFSVVKQIEYPVDDDSQDAEILDHDEWEIYEKPAGKHLRFLESSPSTSESFRVTYTALHTCTDDACTIDSFDDEAVQALAAAHFCEMLATYYSQNQESTLQADVVDHTSKARDYAARAKAYRKIYFDHMGIEEGKVKAASITKDQDMPGSWGSDKLTHPKRLR
jgi:hypothetical protein